MLLAVGGHVVEDMPACCARMATALGGGIARSHEEACGALIGGVMVIGALHGRVDAAENDDLAQSLAARYRERFLAELGTTRCGPLRDWVQGPGGPGTCAVVVERAARMLLDVLS